jgi:3-hydroxyisobutyrate dehydrogenase-like beta-hydroxyacid dehydrogenase
MPEDGPDARGEGESGMRIGFVGLGSMGRPIALNLRKGGTVVATDADPRAREGLAAKGVTVADGLAAVAACEVVFLCLPDGRAVETVLFGADGLAAHLTPGATVVDLSTIAHTEAVTFAGRLAERGVRFLDAPVSGMPARAIDGTLTVMCGGAPEVFEAVRPLLACIGAHILHMGPTGAGQFTKTINNVIYDINIAALAEVLPMAVRLGLEPARLAEVVTTGTARSYAAEFFVPRMLRGDFGEGYPLEKAYKDVTSGLGAALAHGLPTPVLAAAAATYQTAMRQGHGAKDKGAMILPFEDLLGVAFRAPDTGPSRKS